MKSLHFQLCLFTMMVLATSISSAATPAAPATDDALAKLCSQDFQKVSMCLDFATGKAPNPSKQCCESVEDIKEREPKCLCFVIQQSKTGGQALKDLGVQEGKLIQLPSACQLKNASISNCPKLLGLSPSSPDAAVFTSNATSTTTTPATSGKSPTTPAMTEAKGGSASTRDGQAFVFALAAAFMTVSFISSTLGPMMMG